MNEVSLDGEIKNGNFTITNRINSNPPLLACLLCPT